MKLAPLRPRELAAAVLAAPVLVAPVLVALALSHAAAVQAQVPGAQEEPVPPEIVPADPSEAGAPPIDDRKLDQFAQAYIAVEEIHTRTQRELESARDPRQASELKASAEGRIIEAVERSGLKLEEFNRIAEAMSNDRELRMRIADKVRERRRI